MNNKLGSSDFKNNIDTKQINKNIIGSVEVNTKSNVVNLQNSYMLFNSNEADIVVNNINVNEAKNFSDFGKLVTENMPMLNYTSITNIRTECRNMIAKAEKRKKFAVKNDRESDLVNDIITLVSKVLVLCEDNIDNEVFDSTTSINMCLQLHKAKKRYEEIFLNEGWEL